MVKALIVEDNAVLRQSLHELLGRRFPFMGIAEATAGEDAIEQVARDKPDLIFMDVRLPGINGLDATRIIKSTRADSIVCVITSYDLPEYREAALQSGADHFLVKGGSTDEEIVAVVESMLASRIRTVIIEDNAGFRAVLDGILKTRWPSMIVAEAQDGPEGLDDVARLDPHLVVLDLRLPTANGLDLARAIRAHTHSAIVIVTAYDLPEYRDAASLAGVPFLPKSDSVADELVAAVSAILAGRTAH